MAFKASGQHIPFQNTLKWIVQIFWMIVGLVIATRYRNGVAQWQYITINLFPFIGPWENPYNSRILNTATTQEQTREHHYHNHPPHPWQSARDSTFYSPCFSFHLLVYANIVGIHVSGSVGQCRQCIVWSWTTPLLCQWCHQGRLRLGNLRHRNQRTSALCPARWG